MEGPRPTAGLIDLRDLHAWRWQTRRLPGLLASMGLQLPEQGYRSFHPPDRLVVVAPALMPERLEGCLAWLRSAASVLLVRDFEGEPLEAELRELLDAQWDEVAEKLEGLAGRFDCNPGPPGALQVALDRALDLGPSEHSHPEPSAGAISEGRRGPWVALAGEIERTALAPRLCAPPGGPALSVDEALISLCDGPETDAPLVLSDAPAAISPDGYTLLTRSGSLVSRDGERQTEEKTRFGFPVGFDPWHPVATRGYRCTFTWHYVGHGGLAELCTSSHDWPCGHAKKLWGYKDNRPVTVALAPDGGAYVSTFQHDALVSSDVPMSWRVQGGLALADWPPAPEADPLRALFFCTGEIPWPGGDPLDAGDEDVRAFAPVVVLGPDAGCRYAVDLTQPTYRIRGERSERLEGTDGYGVFGADHAQVRRGEGRLLGGWFRFVTILHQRQLWREDLLTGERWALGPAEREIAWALAVPGTRNVVVVADGALRLV